jgi:uncharacterized protein (TIGR02117 family)
MCLIDRILLFLGWAVAGLASLFSAYLLAVLIGGHIMVNTHFEESPDGVAIYAISNGFHVNLYLPAKHPEKNWLALFGREDNPDNPYEYVFFGWGDRLFFRHVPTWEKLDYGIALKAGLWPTRAGIYAGFITYLPRLKDREGAKIMISDAQYSRLCDFIEPYIILDRRGKPIPLEVNYSSLEDYYLANGRYTLLHTCNNWANLALKYAGVRSCLWSPMEAQLIGSLRQED